MWFIALHILRVLPAEFAHNFALVALNFFYKLGLVSVNINSEQRLEKMGLNFPNKFGLAAGLDKNADYIDALGALGFGFIEVGTVTPKPQLGNLRPRLFRLKKEKALINRMGFNNKGIDHLAKKIVKRKYKGILGVNIGKNKLTPNEKAIDDYIYCLEKVYKHADYVTINISSPNTEGLRDLQKGLACKKLLDAISNTRASLKSQYQKYLPVLIKISPDMELSELEQFIDCLLSTDLDGVICTNTTTSRETIHNTYLKIEAGGLSGEPLKELSLNTLKEINKILIARDAKDKITVISVGGISSKEDVNTRLDNGADLIQLYTALIYQGPSIVNILTSASVLKIN